MGTMEGRIAVPPVTARYLFHPWAQPVPEAGISHDSAVSPKRSAYTDATLARAIREGVDPEGRKLDYLMPRYALDDAAMASLISYLKGLSSGPVPGVMDDTLHFATIITPDADPVKRKGMLDVIEHYFAAKNSFARFEAPPMQSDQRMKYRVQRKWQLHVWDLSGEPGTWGDQLRARLKGEPVFAAISGLGGRNWEPVHRFCEEESLPCLLPNVEVPVVAEQDFYDVYFSKGVLLEAQLMARQLRDSHVRQVVQVYREDDVGKAAAKALHDGIAIHGLATADHGIKPGGTVGELAAAVDSAGARDALVLWLRPEDLLRLPAETPKCGAIYLSGLMGGLEKSPLKSEWLTAAHMTYPFELPGLRAARINYPLGWFRIQHIPVVAEQTQVDTYMACGILSENLGHMLDNFLRDYLVEQLEAMLGRRILTGYYPRFGLGPGQRFASKGGYIVRFTGPDEKKLAPEGDWIVP
jgi:hypothetical protein